MMGKCRECSFEVPCLLLPLKEWTLNNAQDQITDAVFARLRFIENLFDDHAVGE